MVGYGVDGPSARAPTPDDLARLCNALNAAGARYIVLGGMAVNYWGYHRATEDVGKHSVKCVLSH